MTRNNNYTSDFYFYTDDLIRSMDNTDSTGPIFQTVVQYLHRQIKGVPLDTFKYIPGSVEGNQKDCLEILLRYNLKKKHYYT